jgi:hypothetical protein
VRCDEDLKIYYCLIYEMNACLARDKELKECIVRLLLNLFLVPKTAKTASCSQDMKVLCPARKETCFIFRISACILIQSWFASMLTTPSLVPVSDKAWLFMTFLECLSRNMRERGY